MIDNTDEYVSLMKRRALGILPDMGCAIRVSGLIETLKDRLPGAALGIEILDVGCATGHFLRTFMHENLPVSKYVGLEIDSAMIDAARAIWCDTLRSGTAQFVNADLEQFTSESKFDFVICMNAFMYFASAKTALTNLMRATRHHLLVRSYFTDANYRIMRAQTKSNHDKSQLSETDVFDDAGNMRCYDFWNMYSYAYIEALVAEINPAARLEWIEDRNVRSSMEAEDQLNISKRGATQMLAGYEVSYPFILPWKYLSITVTNPSFDAHP